MGWWFCRTSICPSRELQKCILATDLQTYNRNTRGAMRSRNIWSSTQMCKKHASDIHQSASTSTKISKHLDQAKNAQTRIQICNCVNKWLYCAWQRYTVFYCTVRCGAVCLWTPQGAWNIVWKEKREKDDEEWRIEEDVEWQADV